MISSDFNNSGSDLFMLNERCLKNGIPSPIEFDAQTGRPYIRGRTHIDLFEVFKKEMVKSTIFKNKYRTLKLEEVALLPIELAHGIASLSTYP
jgi:DNA polymerase elongation subunit (family B)